MLIFALDDEPHMLDNVRRAIEQAAPGAELRTFAHARDALEAVQSQGLSPDIVFSDIEMPGISGLEFAVALKTASPDTRVVFVTGYSKYALDAYSVRPQNFLMKPLTPDQVKAELKQLPRPLEWDQEKLIVQCFGNFEVYWKGKPLQFSRKKTKELLAFLVDREGGWCTSEEIIDALWEDGAEGKEKKHYLRVLASELSVVLKDIGVKGALLRKRGQWAIDRGMLDCDYYRMRDGDPAALNAYHGEYMRQYSWAEMTTGRLHFQVQE